MKFNDDLEKQIQLAKIAKAIGHPTRIAILLFLKERNSCYFGSIHEELPIAKATVSQHLKELRILPVFSSVFLTQCKLLLPINIFI